MIMADSVIIHTDGGARGNPGPAAIGVVVEANNKTIASFGRYIGETTNNQAEYQAVHAALEHVKTLGASKVELFCDSELVIKQLRGEYKMKNKELGPWLIKIHSLINQIGQVNLKNIPREQNTVADALVNQTLDTQAETSSDLNDIKRLF